MNDQLKQQIESMYAHPEQPASEPQPTNEPTGMEVTSQPEPEAIPTAQADTPIPQAEVQPTVDYNSLIGEMSGGLFTSVDDFKASLPKITEYDSLATQKSELESKLNQNPFANDYVKKLNELVASGAEPDKLRNFQKVNEIGDPSKLSPTEAKVAKMVMVDGFSEEIARQIVEQDFPLNDYEEGSTERVILQEKLRVSALNDQKELSKFVAEVSVIDNSEQLKQEEQRLGLLAAQTQFTNHVKSVAPSIAQTIKGIGEMTLLDAKEGEDAPKMNFEYSEDFKKGMPELISNYFLETATEVNTETIEEASRYIKANYLEENFESILKSACKTVEALTWEKAVNKYENRSGLPKGQEPVNVENTQSELQDFMSRVANRTHKQQR